jgi:hypothetical protein
LHGTGGVIKYNQGVIYSSAAESWEVLAMRVLCGILMVVGSILGMLVSFFGTITVNSEISIINGIQLSIGLGIFFLFTALGGVYIIANSD